MNVKIVQSQIKDVRLPIKIHAPIDTYIENERGSLDSDVNMLSFDQGPSNIYQP